MINKLLDFFQNKNILILGFGLEGQSTYKLIRKHLPKQMLSIADKTPNFNEQHDFLKQDKHLHVISGEQYLNNLAKYDLIIKTPGLSFKGLDISSFAEKITSQLALFLEFIDVYTIGVTGTKGKSTTSSLIYCVLTEQKINTLLLGNIGIPIFDCLETMTPDMKVILELSSHQLQFIKKSPNLGIILNIFAEHLDHYNTFDGYIAAKFNIAKFQTETDYFIYNLDNELISAYINKHQANFKSHQYGITLSPQAKSNQYLFINGNNISIHAGNKTKALYDITGPRKLLGNHNLNNIMFVYAVNEILNLELNQTAKSINNFNPLEHRMEYVGYFNNIHFYNDVIATIPEATINCLETLKEVSTLIIGGIDRGIDFTNFIDYLSKCRVKNIICMPATGTFIGQALKRKKTSLNIYDVADLKEAVALSKKITEPEKICVLSPAAASYAYYKNFKEKGAAYKKLVTEK